MARRRPAGRPGRRRPRARRRRGRARRRVAAPRLGGDALGGKAPATEATARRETSRGLGRRCRRPGRPLRSSAERSACSCSSLCRSSFPMRGHRRRDARHRRSPHRRALPRRRDALRRADVARRRLGGHCSCSRRPQSSSVVGARGARRAVVPDAAERLRPQAVARRPGVRARPAACRPARLRAHGGVARRDRALACAGRDPDRVHGPRPSSARRERCSSVRPHRPLRDRPVQRPSDGRGRPPARDRVGAVEAEVAPR